jgi:hypothetical protein
MSSAAECDERARLLKEYEESVEVYNLAVGALVDARPRVSREAYLRVTAQAEEILTRIEQVRSAMKKHTAEHRC